MSPSAIRERRGPSRRRRSRAGQSTHRRPAGIVELIPPHSIGIVANALRPRCASSLRSEATASSPLGIFSTSTVGAPIIAVGITSASSGTSLGSRTTTVSAFVHRRLHHQPADIGIAAAARAKKGGADREIQKVLSRPTAASLSPYLVLQTINRSPTALTRMRVALPGK